MAVVPQEPASDLHGVPPGVVIQPIDSIDPFCAGKIWIKARLTEKSDVRTWEKPESQGQLFSFTLVDGSASIRCTVFKKAVETLFPMLQNGKVYVFGGGYVKSANRKFSNVKNDYELTFDLSTQVIEQADSALIPISSLTFVPIGTLFGLEAESVADVLAVVAHVGEISNITQKETGKEFTKRVVLLADMTGSMGLALWGEKATKWSFEAGAVIAISGAKICTFDGGLLLGISFNSCVDIPPATPDVENLRVWFGKHGKEIKPLPAKVLDEGPTFPLKFFNEMDAEGLGKGKEADVVEVSCRILLFKKGDLWYDACPDCYKKVVAGNSAEEWKCPKCCKVVVPKPRFVLSMEVRDEQMTRRWVKVFHEIAEQLLGVSAALFKGHADAGRQAVLKSASLRKMLLRLRVKEDEEAFLSTSGRPSGKAINYVVLKIVSTQGADAGSVRQEN